MKTLTTTRPLGTANRWRVERAVPFDDQARAVVTVQLLNGGNILVSEAEVHIRDGLSDRVSINLAPVRLSESLAAESAVVATPTGYADAVNAWRGGTTMTARREALETWMLSAGVAHTTLAGT